MRARAVARLFVGVHYLEKRLERWRTMSSSSSSLGASGDHRISLQVRINRCCPPPEHWTKVKELNVENREPCEIWRSGVGHQLAKLKEHMTACEHVIQHLDQSMSASMTSRRRKSSTSSPTTRATPTNTNTKTVGTQTN